MKFIHEFTRDGESPLISFDETATAALQYGASRANTLRTGRCGARNLEKLNISVCSDRHLCSKFTQLDITLTRRMFGIIKLGEQPR